MASSNEDTGIGLWNRRNFLATSVVSTMSITFLDQSPANAAPAATPDLHSPYATTIDVNGHCIILQSMSLRRCSTPCATISVLPAARRDATTANAALVP